MFDVRVYFEGRGENRTAFLKKHLVGDFVISTLAEDWASRRYFRVKATDKTHVLMEAVPDHIPTATMGHKLFAFLKIARLLHEKGIHAPEILAVDEREGYVLLEDFGDVTVNAALENGEDAFNLYSAATDVLIAMRDNIGLNDLCDFTKYKESYIFKGRQRIVDWYIPATRREKNPDGLLASYLEAWTAVTAQLPPPRIGFIHGDFHLQNLMLLPDGTCGVLDFQDAMAGPVVYDLANLLENIRKDVPRDIYDAMLKKYGGDEGDRAWFRVMATQFHCRIIGQVLRLAIVSGKSDLLKYIPRIQNYLIEGLKDPVLKPLADWIRTERVDLTVQDCFDPEKVKSFIRDDAF
jgi:aminoglycoside/choline kinase family phosphotransferase